MRASNLSTIAATADALFDIYGLEHMPVVEPVLRTRGVSLHALTEQELRWMAEAVEIED